MCISSGFESRIPLWRLTFSTFREFPRSLLIPCSHGHANWELSILLIGHFFAKDGRMEHQRVVTMFGDMILFFNAFFQCVYVFKNTRMIHIIMMYIYIYCTCIVIYIYSYWGGICYSPEEDIQLSCGSKKTSNIFQELKEGWRMVLLVVGWKDGNPCLCHGKIHEKCWFHWIFGSPLEGDTKLRQKHVFPN